MGLSSDVSGDISPGLAKTIRFLYNSAETVEEPTLGKVQDAIRQGLLRHLVKRKLIAADDEENIEKEIQALVERHGDDMLANELVTFLAGENLAAIIRAVMQQRDLEEPPTLDMVYRVMTTTSLLADLIGAGQIDPDEDDTLIDEIRQLIDLHGGDAPAEEFLP